MTRGDDPLRRSLDRLRDLAEAQARQIELVQQVLSRNRAGRARRIEPGLPAREPAVTAFTPAPAIGRRYWPTSETPETALVPRPGNACLSLAGRDLPATAVTLFGQRGPALEQLVAMIAARQRDTMSFKPVFLTDTPDQDPFIARGYVFEYFPPAIYGAGAAERDANPHYRARMGLLWRKWDIQAIIELNLPDPKPAAATPAEADALPDAEAAAASLPGPQRESGRSARRGAGKRQPRKPVPDDAELIRDSGLFDAAFYVGRHPEAAADPIRHYLEVGAAAGYDPHPLFNTAHYARQLAAARRRASGKK